MFQSLPSSSSSPGKKEGNDKSGSEKWNGRGREGWRGGGGEGEGGRGRGKACKDMPSGLFRLKTDGSNHKHLLKALKHLLVFSPSAVSFSISFLITFCSI